MSRAVVIQPRHGRRRLVMQRLIAEALARGEHVHSASAANGERCHGGAPDCPTPKADDTPA